MAATSFSSLSLSLSYFLSFFLIMSMLFTIDFQSAYCRIAKGVESETKVIKFRKVRRFFLEQSDKMFSLANS